MIKLMPRGGTRRPPRAVTKFAYALHKHRAKNLTQDLARRGKKRTIGRPVIVGFLGANIGLGYAARLYWQAFQDMGLDPATIDLSKSFANFHHGLLPQTTAIDDSAGPMVFVINPPEIPRAINILKNLGVNLSGRLRILACAWEQEQAPPQWADICSMFDVVWAPSHFVKSAIEFVSHVPVERVPYPLSSQAVPDVDVPENPIVADKFTILSAFDDQSTRSRKNPDATISVFREAFGDDPSVQLVLKASNLSICAAEILRERLSNYSNIILFTGALTDNEMLSLVAQCDAILSLSRAEGFGLLSAQSLSLGVAVIATAGTGSAEFESCPDYTPIPFTPVPPSDAVEPYRAEWGAWHEPDEKAAISALRSVRNKRQNRSVDVKSWWEERFSPSAIWASVHPDTQYYFALSEATKKA